MTDSARVESLLHLRRYAEARDRLRPLLAEHPDDPDLHGLHAQALIGLDDCTGALDAGNRLVALEPEQEWGHRICAVALRRLGRHQDAVAAAAEAVRLAPMAWQSHHQFALCALAVPRRMQEALAAASRAVSLGPHEPDPHFAYGLVAEALRRHDEARAAYQHTLALDPQHAGALNNLTLMGSRLRLAPAAHGFAAALRHQPDLDVARANVDVLAFRFVRRIYWAALAALVVGLLASHGTAEGGEVTPVTVGVGALLLVGVIGYSAALARAIPVGIHRFVRRRLVTDGFLLVTWMLTAAMLSTVLLVCFVPGAAGVAVGLLRPIGLVNVALFVWAAVRQHT